MFEEVPKNVKVKSLRYWSKVFAVKKGDTYLDNKLAVNICENNCKQTAK